MEATWHIFVVALSFFVFFVFQRKKTSKGKKIARYVGKFGAAEEGWKGMER